MRKRVLLLITTSFLFSTHAFATLSYDDWPNVAGPYFGQELPGMTAEIFAPDRDEFYFTTWTREDGFDIWFADRTETGWGEE